jgi:hypothetical protein
MVMRRLPERLPTIAAACPPMIEPDLAGRMARVAGIRPIAPVDHYGGNGQIFGAKQQVPHG